MTRFISQHQNIREHACMYLVILNEIIVFKKKDKKLIIYDKFIDDSCLLQKLSFPYLFKKTSPTQYFFNRFIVHNYISYILFHRICMYND